MERILIAVDGSEASDRAIDYLGRMIAGAPERHVHVVHVLPPAGHRERGAEAEARGLLERVRARLVDAGLPGEHVDIGVLSSVQDAPMVTELVDLARDQECSTIVVGRSSLPWHRELFHHHAADELVRAAHGFTLWIVE